MNFKDIEESQAINFHLSLHTQIDADTIVFSSLVAILKDVRGITGRDPNTGARGAGDASSWLAASGYLTLLDQIGKTYKVRGRNDSRTNPIIGALENFAQIPLDEAEAIYSLRCAFMHDFSLFNIDNRKGNNKRTHHFTVTGHGYDKSNRLVTLPIKRWDGNYYSKTVENQTVINIPLLGDTAERVYQKIVELNADSELEIKLPGGFKELISRYLMFVHISE